jgi:phosphotransferase system enzyme I (PtsI)
MVAAKRSAPVETRLKGVPLSPGVVVGRACFYKRQQARPDLALQPSSQQEVQRVHHALTWLARQRSVLARKAEAKLGHEHAEIFQAHRLLLIDESFHAQLAGDIEENGHSAEHAVETVLNRYKEQLAAADSEYLQQRVADISEIQRDLLAYLNREVACRRCSDAVVCGVKECRLGNDHILVGEELTASLPIETDHHTIGFVVEKGGPNSHAVILARAARCPVVGNIHDPFASIPLDAQILIDGGSGEVILNPSEKTRARYQSPPAARRHAVEVSEPLPDLKVMANIGQSADVGEALAAGAEGIGLYRTEMEVLVAGRLLSEAEQSARYSEVLRAMVGRGVCIRLLDLGNDKTAEWLKATPQRGALAGHRGARLLLASPDLLREQARALARASVHGPVQVLYPMISDVEQFLELRALFDQAVVDLKPVGLQHGVLFEVPAACLAARQLMDAADFGCIGTNDLIQYLFAADRSDGDAVSHSHFETAAVLWDLIQSMSRTARQAGKPMTICGELAGNPELTCRIMQSGLTAVSTSPSRIAGVRRAARDSSISDSRSLYHGFYPVSTDG